MPEKIHNGPHISLQQTRSEEVQEIMGKMPHWIIRSGITLIGILILCLIAGAWFFSYPDAVPAHVTIITRGQAYSVTADAAAADTWKIKAGQKVLIRLKAYPYEEFGVLEGRIAAQAGILTGDTYKVGVQLDKPFFTSRGKEIPLQPRLSGRAEILTEKQSVLQRIFYSF
jgi:hypothetical protein